MVMNGAHVSSSSSPAPVDSEQRPQPIVLFKNILIASPGDTKQEQRDYVLEYHQFYRGKAPSERKPPCSDGTPYRHRIGLRPPNHAPEPAEGNTSPEFEKKRRSIATLPKLNQRPLFHRSTPRKSKQRGDMLRGMSVNRPQTEYVCVARSLVSPDINSAKPMAATSMSNHYPLGDVAMSIDSETVCTDLSELNSIAGLSESKRPLDSAQSQNDFVLPALRSNETTAASSPDKHYSITSSLSRESQPQLKLPHKGIGATTQLVRTRYSNRNLPHNGRRKRDILCVDNIHSLVKDQGSRKPPNAEEFISNLGEDDIIDDASYSMFARRGIKRTLGTMSHVQCTARSNVPMGLSLNRERSKDRIPLPDSPRKLRDFAACHRSVYAQHEARLANRMIQVKAGDE